MYRQQYLQITGRSAFVATRRLLTRRLLLAVAACVLGLMPGTPRLAETGPVVAQAAQPNQPHRAAPATGLAGAVPPTSSGPKDYPPNLIVRSTGAPDEQLDVAAALDQGARLFLLQAHYQDAGNGQADYYLAGPQGVSHQPVRELFAPLREWLAAPRHEHEMVMLGLRTDPRSANPARFDAACQSLMSALGPYLLKASDLPKGKTLDELTPNEMVGAWRAQPRVITDWSACTGAGPPLGRRQAQPAAAVPVEDHWMADQKDIIGQIPLRQVVIPGSHDAATYDDPSCPSNLCWPWGPAEAAYTQAQSQGITAQLNAGSRYFDLRFSYGDPGYGGQDFYNYHGTDKNGNPNLSYLKMSTVLGDIDTWIDQPGHEREIVWLDMLVYREDQDPSQSKAICNATLGQELAQGKLLQSRMLPPNTALSDMSMNEIWALPGHPRIIVTGWSNCTGDSPMTEGSTYASKCFGQEIWHQIHPDLLARTSYGNVVTGAYVLFVQATPFSTNQCWPYSIRALAPQQTTPLSELKWFADNPYDPNIVLARDNLNVMAGDFLGDPAGGGAYNWPIVQTALTLIDPYPEAQSWTADPSASKPVTVSCHNPTTVGPTTIVVYPLVQGPNSPNVKTFTTDQGYPGVQGSVSLDDFPGAGGASDGSYLVALCTRDGSPLAPPGSSNGVGLSRIVIPLSAFGTLPLLGATPIPGDPVDLRFTCFGSGAKPIQVTAYPAAAGPNSPDAQVFVSANGQPTVQADYSRRGNYDVRLDCLMSGTTRSLTVRASAFSPALSIEGEAGPPPAPQDWWLYCRSAWPYLTSPATFSLVAQTPNAPPPLKVTGSPTLILPLIDNADYFPNGDYQLIATCDNSDTPPWTATPLILSSSQIPMTLRAKPSSDLQLAITCVNFYVNEAWKEIHAVAYPAAAGPNSPDAQSFDAPTGQFTLQATYRRRANYDVRVDCTFNGGSLHTVTVPASAFPPALSIRADPQDRWLYCDGAGQLPSPATFRLVAQTPNAPPPLIATGSPTLILTVQPDYFPAGDYQLNATCLSSDKPPFMATPLTLSSSQIPTQKVTAWITGCSAPGGNAYACALQVTLGVPLAVNTVFSVGIGGDGFANPSGGDRPQVTAFQGCQGPPLPSPYLAAGNSSYTRYDVNIGPGGCTAGAVMTFGEAVTGAAGATITQPVTVPGLDPSTATFVLP